MGYPHDERDNWAVPRYRNAGRFAPIRPVPRRSGSRALWLVGVPLLAVLSLATYAFRDQQTETSSAATLTTGASAVSVAPTTTPAGGDLAGAEPAAGQGCVLTASKLVQGDTNADVVCLQAVLIASGFLDGPGSGSFDISTVAAVQAVQTDRNLYVDGIVGRETAIELDIWPTEGTLVVRTSPPTSGAKDSMGFRLSSVASTGDNAPALPENSGTGRRLVYQRAGQRVWAVDKNGDIIRSWLVSGSKYENEEPGTHEVWSRSEMSTAWNGKAHLPKMVRWLKTDKGAIGFHGLPRHVEDDSPYQTEAELGTRLSGGCQRQADLDAAFTWEFAQIGTNVVVI